MNKNTAVVVTILGVAVIALIAFFLMQPAPAPEVNAPVTTTTSTTTTTTVGTPIVTTGSASSVTATTARLNGQLNPNGAATTYWFEYNKDSFLGGVLASSTQEQVASGSTTVSVSASISNLDADSRYYFRLVGRNQYGTVRGDIMSFTTAK